MDIEFEAVGVGYEAAGKARIGGVERFAQVKKMSLSEAETLLSGDCPMLNEYAEVSAKIAELKFIQQSFKDLDKHRSSELRRNEQTKAAIEAIFDKGWCGW